MKIILSAYNFYPVHKGGTEVYTKALAVYLQGINLEVLVIVALDESNTIHGKVITDNDEIKAAYYLYENIAVLGVQLKGKPQMIFMQAPVKYGPKILNKF
ncbi:MAG: hypothetical protein IPF70_08545 [Saprospiraceae bacterium]|nr:hypothetical protein [Saprospiraceae bacterium]